MMLCSTRKASFILNFEIPGCSRAVAQPDGPFRCISIQKLIYLGNFGFSEM